MTQPEKEALERLCNEHCAALAEHVDSVQIFVTWHDGGEETTSAYQCGRGSIYSRWGQVSEWLVRQEEFDREDARIQQRREYEE